MNYKSFECIQIGSLTMKLLLYGIGLFYRAMLWRDSVSIESRRSSFLTAPDE